MDNIWIKLLIICPLVFIGALVDAIAGGGGLITLPAYLIAGVPVQLAVATNKFSASCSAVISAFRFARQGTVQMFIALPSAGLAIIGSVLGSRLLLAIDERVVQILLLVLLPVMVLVLLRSKKMDSQSAQDTSIKPDFKTIAVSCTIGFVIGGYDGFFGPGTGTFLTLAFVYILHLELRNAMGNTKIVNLASNLAALVTFLLSGKIVFAVGIPAAACGILGSYIGAGLALKNGSRIFKPVFVLVFILLFIKIISDLLYR